MVEGGAMAGRELAAAACIGVTGIWLLVAYVMEGIGEERRAALTACIVTVIVVAAVMAWGWLIR